MLKFVEEPFILTSIMCSLPERFETAGLFLRLMLSWSLEKITKRCSRLRPFENKVFWLLANSAKSCEAFKAYSCGCLSLHHALSKIFLSFHFSFQTCKFIGFRWNRTCSLFSRVKRFSYNSSVLWFHTKEVLQGLSTIGLCWTTWRPFKECLGDCFFNFGCSDKKNCSNRLSLADYFL